MKKINKVTIFGLMAALALAFATTAAPAMAWTCLDGSHVNAPGDCEEYTNVENTDKDLDGTFNTVVNVIIGIVGFLAVIMIIVGGITYTTSAGDANKVKKAKDTIMYGVIGLIIALLAFAIVNFVLKNLGS